jgi:succinate dehydrogenase/fumarate reductase iron-sulfur protein
MRPVKVTYDVPLQDKMRVMDALNYIRENCDSSLAFRFSCRYYAKCGTCAVMVNGKPVLSCYEEARDGILVEPLANFPVTRDLIVDRSDWDLRVSQQLKRLTEAPSGVKQG